MTLINGETAPLLPAEGQAAHVPRATIASAMFNMMMSAVGAGLLAFPFAMASSGVALTVLWTAIFAFFVVTTINIIVRLTQKHRLALTVCSFEELMHYMLGEWAYRASVVAVLGGQMGSLIGFTIIIADITQPVLEVWCGTDSVLAQRWLIILVYTVVIMLPLSMFEDIHSLAIPSAIGVISVLAVFGILAFRGIDTAAHHAIPSGVVYGARTGAQVFLAPPICLFALGMHLQAVSVTRELPPHRQDKMPSIVAACQICCVVLYCLTGLFGYMIFGPTVQGDVLKDFPLSDVPADVAKILMGLHVSISYPVCLYPAKRAVLYIFVRLGGKAKFDWRFSLLTSIVVVIITGTVATVVPQVSVVFGLATTSFGVWVVFIGPALLVLKDHLPGPVSSSKGDYTLTAPHSYGQTAPERSWWQIVQCVVLMTVGILMTIVGTSIIVIENWIR